MLELVALAGLLFAGLAVFAVLGMVFFIVKLAFWVVFFPIRLIMKLLWLPFGLIAGAFSVAAGAALLPILLLVGIVIAVVGAIGALLALLIPAIPFLLLGLMIWAFMRKPPVTA